MDTVLACCHCCVGGRAKDCKLFYCHCLPCWWLAWLQYEPVYRYKIPVSYKNTGIIPVRFSVPVPSSSFWFVCTMFVCVWSSSALIKFFWQIAHGKFGPLPEAPWCFLLCSDRLLRCKYALPQSAQRCLLSTGFSFCGVDVAWGAGSEVAVTTSSALTSRKLSMTIPDKSIWNKTNSDPLSFE